MNRLTIGITSCNRMFYVKALLKSLLSIKHSDIQTQIIVVDNGSTEVGLQSYLKSLKDVLIDDLALRYSSNRDWINDEYIAKNIIIEKSKYENILFLQDDCQFIGTSNLLTKYVEDFKKLDVPCLDIFGIRQSILNQRIDSSFKQFEKIKYWNLKDNHFMTTGIFSKSIFDENGYYITDWETNKNNWGNSENEYDNRLKKRIKKDLTVKSHIPLFISIWNDPRGGYAFIRGNKRFGNYIQAKNDLYYDNLTESECENLLKNNSPVSFDDVAKPLGWEYPKNNLREHVKYGQEKFISEGPFSELP